MGMEVGKWMYGNGGMGMKIWVFAKAKSNMKHLEWHADIVDAIKGRHSFRLEH